ncbi:hypothetical protein T439DRAFT_44079 [Meredithblackwellia eburnea MCA 4105]
METIGGTGPPLQVTTSATSSDSTLHDHDLTGTARRRAGATGAALAGAAALAPTPPSTPPSSPAAGGGGIVNWITKTLSLSPSLTKVDIIDEEQSDPPSKLILEGHHSEPEQVEDEVQGHHQQPGLPTTATQHQTPSERPSTPSNQPGKVFPAPLNHSPRSTTNLGTEGKNGSVHVDEDEEDQLPTIQVVPSSPSQDVTPSTPTKVANNPATPVPSSPPSRVPRIPLSIDTTPSAPSTPANGNTSSGSGSGSGGLSGLSNVSGGFMSFLPSLPSINLHSLIPKLPTSGIVFHPIPIPEGGGDSDYYSNNGGPMSPVGGGGGAGRRSGDTLEEVQEEDEGEWSTGGEPRKGTVRRRMSMDLKIEDGEFFCCLLSVFLVLAALFFVWSGWGNKVDG